MQEETPFSVTEEIIVGDLTDVKETKNILPVSQNVKVRIAKAAVMENKDKDIKSLKLELRIVDGIPVVDQESGETELKYANKPMFTGIMDLVLSANVDVKQRSTKDWWTTKQHQVGLKKFCQALDIDLATLKVNDEFLISLIGRELAVDISHEEETSMAENGQRIKLGTYREKLRNWKKLA